MSHASAPGTLQEARNGREAPQMPHPYVEPPASGLHAVLVDLADLAEVVRRIEQKLDWTHEADGGYRELCEALGQPFNPVKLPRRESQ